jgi:hypothetical protein
MPDRERVEFIESYIKIGNGDYKWNDNHGELIRCKDCKYCKVIDWDNSNPYYGSCQYFNTHTVDADGFCYKAERKDSD